MSKDPNRALSPRYNGIPLRYEDSKPVQVQEYAHTTIVRIGDTIHKDLLDELENDKKQTIEAAKAAVWQEAEQIKADALEKSRQYAKIDREKAINNLKKVHEKALKEEALRVEGEMQKLTIDQVTAEREMGEKKVTQAIAKTKNEGVLAKTKAVREARCEEKKIAKDAAEILAKQVAQREEETAKRVAEEKQKALKELQDKLVREKERAVSETMNRERKVAAAEVASIKAAHSQQVNYLEYQIRTHYINHQEALKEITRLEKEKAQLQEEYTELKQEFQSFINKSSGFEEGQADFLLA
ncbi:uncharacterized protein C6orf163-like [Saccoglossus kowalevskii]|uniref:Axoneme-associated protein mst101(2)-like n=1 Tax=Saccoglossus kowalevskii TaxID=10224 RepID=A0ABM0M633_SACKO|nr:PREDICTED: axoneme-associated protein mst101(2)-like [Saccoglossus kowalevskii]